MSNQSTLIEKMACAGTAACIADVMTFPFDVAKVRLQVLGTSAVAASFSTATAGQVAVGLQTPQFQGLTGTLIYLVRNEGFKSLYNGIVPGLQRQCLFASLRVGFYDNVKDFYSSVAPFSSSSYSGLMAVRIASGITTGAIAITVAQPTDVVKVRMQAASKGGASNASPRYKNSLHAYKTIYRGEGLRGLWTGLGPNVARNSVVNAAELVCYDTIKDLLISYKIMQNGLLCHFTAAFSAGFCATVVASPIDVVKTRIMNSPNGQFKGMLDCAGKLYKENGLKAFYKGFTPSFMRMGTWNVCMFMSYEQLKKLSGQYKESLALSASVKAQDKSTNSNDAAFGKETLIVIEEETETEIKQLEILGKRKLKNSRAIHMIPAL